MVVYNFNQGIGWASSGVEYAQSYRGKIFRKLGVDARFIFTDMIRGDNIQELTKNLHFEEREVIWMYQFFTDFPIAPCSLTEEQVAASFPEGPWKINDIGGGRKQYVHEEQKLFITMYFSRMYPDKVSRVEYVAGGCLLRTDHYTTGLLFSEFFAPKDGEGKPYERRFYNQNGTIAFEEFISHEGDDYEKNRNLLYRFPKRTFYSKEEFVEFFVCCLQIRPDDLIIADRTTLVGQAIFKYHGRTKMGVVVHADHFSEPMTDDDNILWNNYYEYPFNHTADLSFFITSTKRQKEVMEEQFQKYYHIKPRIAAIPVGSLDELKRPEKPRRAYSVLTVSRLAGEKHVDWLCRAVIQAKEKVPKLQFDIYGRGVEEENLRKIIQEHHAEEYIHLMGHRDMADIYQNYCAYIAASTSEGFGLSLMEAVGSGLPMVGFDVPYGNQTFIRPNENGYLLDFESGENLDSKELVEELRDAIVKLFTEADLPSFSEVSYQVAEEYLTANVEAKMKRLLEEL